MPRPATAHTAARALRRPERFPPASWRSFIARRRGECNPQSVSVLVYHLNDGQKKSEAARGPRARVQTGHAPRGHRAVRPAGAERGCRHRDLAAWRRARGPGTEIRRDAGTRAAGDGKTAGAREPRCRRPAGPAERDAGAHRGALPARPRGAGGDAQVFGARHPASGGAAAHRGRVRDYFGRGRNGNRRGAAAGAADRRCRWLAHRRRLGRRLAAAPQFLDRPALMLATFLRICLLRANPQDLPASAALPAAALLVHLAVDVLTALDMLPLERALQAGFADTVLLAAFAHAGLTLRRLENRLRQTLAALAGCGAALGLAAYAALGLLGEAIPAGFIWAVYLLWYLAVFSHILRHALSLSLPAAAAVAFLYVTLSATVSGVFLVPSGAEA